jgi:hypothetical protein
VRFVMDEMCDSPYQSAHYHILGSKLGAVSLAWHLAYLGLEVFVRCNS